jgi:hypothetical protein
LSLRPDLRPDGLLQISNFSNQMNNSCPAPVFPGMSKLKQLATGKRSCASQ